VLTGIKQRNLLLDRCKPLLEITRCGAHHDQHRSAIAALLADQHFHSLMLNAIFALKLANVCADRSDITLNFLQDLEHCCLHVLAHGRNIP
jgi:hypothetical protein